MLGSIASVLLLTAAAFAQNVNPNSTVAQGHSFTAWAPWTQSGIPNLIVRGHDSYTCADLTNPHILGADIPLGAKNAILTWGINDVINGVSPADHIACVEAGIEWLQANRPGTAIYIDNVAPLGENNCYPDVSPTTIMAYNTLYAALPAEYDVTLVDIWTPIVMPNGYAWLGDMDGDCREHPGIRQQLNPGWAFYMGANAAAVEQGSEK